MLTRTPRFATAVAVLAASAGLASAQPQPPVSPPRPAFSPYLGMLGPWGPGFGYFGITQPQQQFMQQNFQNQVALQAQQQQLMNLQTQMTTGPALINPYLPVTGRGATFNNLGHWYPAARNGGGGGYGGMMMGSRGGMGLGGGAMGGATSGARTAGSGIPIGPRR